MNTPQILQAVPILPAADVRAAVDFYVEKLGFSEVFSHGEPPGYAGVMRDGVLVHLCHMEDAQRWAEQTMLRFAVSNLDGLFAQMQEAGVVHPNGGLRDEPWGTREFTVLDLDGVCITFSEKIAAA